MNNKCITGLSPRGHCGAAAYCPEPHDCCAKCDKDCNIRCGYLPDRKDPKKGLTAVYNYPNNGYRPASQLEVGKEYSVERVDMGGFHTSIWLAGFSTTFNSVQFDFFEDGQPIDIYRSPKYNPFLRRRADHG